MARSQPNLLRGAKPLVMMLLSFGISQCTFKKNQPEHPYPSESRVSRDFFETKDKAGRVRLKTFLAGWSPEMSAGKYSAAVFVHYNHAEHVNVVFDTTAAEDKLIGKMVVPSFQSDGEDCLTRDSEAAKACRARWPNIVTIPIQSRFYYERQKDGRGRETDVYTENTSRSHWSARPYMNLDLKGIKIKDWAMDIMWNGHEVYGIEDIEGPKDGFLAFTLEVSDTFYGSRMQGKFRFNFLEFDHDTQFTPTPYRHDNSKYLNVLHVIGKEIDGDPENPVMYAAHWNTRRKHTIWLHGFPEESYENIAKDVINQWNDAFEKVGHGRPFEVKISRRKYAFDLRYPTITWVADRRLSYSAPLGVGMALADVRNGEIRWGGVTIWGGMLEEIINRYSANAAVDGVVESMSLGGKPIVQLSLMEPELTVPKVRLPVPQDLLSLSSTEAVKADLTRQMNFHRQALEGALAEGSRGKWDLEKIRALTGFDPEAEQKALKAVDLIQQLQQGMEFLNAKFLDKTRDQGKQVLDAMAAGLVGWSKTMNLIAGQIGSADKIYNADFIQDLIKMPKLAESVSYLPTQDQRGLKDRLANKQSLSKKDMLDLLRSSARSNRTGNAAFDMDRSFYHQAEGYAHGLAQADIDKVQALRALIKDLLLHEVGHMLGLGHNFKENILPEPGSVPNTSTKVGLYKPFALKDLQSAARDQFKNYTTVMGYKDGVTDTLMKYEELMPGPADILSLEYLYNARYPVYPKNAKGEGDFEFVKLDKDGWIVENLTNSYRPAFFPACNDIEASMGSDPYCARWDRGYNASTIVNNHFENFRANLVSSLNAFTDTIKGGSSWRYEMYLWHRALSAFSRARVFYDHMRQKYDADFRQMADSGSEDGIQNLLQFSETCDAIAGRKRIKTDPKLGREEGSSDENKYLKSLFANKDKHELLDLCVAGSQLVEELDHLMQLAGKDYTVIDYFNKYASGSILGGEARADFSRYLGTWKELARMPIKISALMTLASPYPYALYGGWIVPIDRYSRQDGGYHISTAYAKQYTRAVASGVEMNLTLGNSSLDQSTTIGRTVLAMGYFLNHTFMSNDILRVGVPFIENIRSQTEFRYSLAMIDVKKEDEKNKPIGRKFTGTIYNIYARGPEKIPDLYLYTQNRTIVRPPPGSLLLPLSKIRWYDKDAGYFYAIKLDYADEFFDRLNTNSVRRTLNETYQDVVRKCIEGTSNNGLRYFFNKSTSEFPGFKFMDTLGNGEDYPKNQLLESIEEHFRTYYSKESKLVPVPERRFCEEAIRGQAVLVMAASVLNGFYFLNLYDYLEKDLSW
ncbi:MAG: hypothetical protein AB7G93_12550 [Bdellovibrionales bacterium]